MLSARNIFFYTQKFDAMHFWVPKKGTSGAQHENQRTVLKSVTENDSKTGFKCLRYLAFIFICLIFLLYI